MNSIGTRELSSRARHFVVPTQETVGSLVYLHAKAEANYIVQMMDDTGVSFLISNLLSSRT